MAWQFVAASSAVATGANPTPAVPSGYQAGDLLVFVHTSSASSGANNPSGYTNLVRNTSAAPYLAVWYKTAGASESAVSITNADASTAAAVYCYRYTGGNDVMGSIVAGSTTTVTDGTVTTTKANGLVIHAFGGGKTASSTGSWSAVTGCTSRLSRGSSTTLTALLVADENKAAAGLTTGRAGTLSRASTGTQGVVLTFKSGTHDGTGALGRTDGATVAGTAQHNIPHSTSGTLTGQGAEVVGAADRTGGVVNHATTGTLVGQGAAVSGSASRLRAFSTSGTLTGQGAAVTGSAQHNALHTTTGTLTGQGSSVSGSSARFRAFATSGDLIGQGAAINGSASRSAGPVTHSTSGSLTGQGSEIAGSATRFRAMATSGVLVGQGATVEGVANRIAAPVSHATSGALVGQGSEVVGSGLRYRQLSSSGSLVGQGSTLSGEASRVHEHYTSGELTGQGSAVVGSADLLHIVKTHETSGDLVGQGAVISAEVGNGLKPSGGGTLSAIKKARKAAEEARLKAAEAERLKNEAITAEILAPKPVPVDYVAIEQESRRTKRKVEAARIQAEQAIAIAADTGSPVEPVAIVELPSVNDLLISEQISSIAATVKESLTVQTVATGKQVLQVGDDDDALALIMILAEMD